MTRRQFNSNSDTEKSIAYSRAVVDGDWIFVAGTTGMDYAQGTISDDMEEQTEQCVHNVAEVLRHAGSSLRDVVSILYVVAHAQDVQAVSKVLKKHFDDIRPTCMMMVAQLVDPRMRMEMQTTARRGSGERPQERTDITLGARPRS